MKSKRLNIAMFSPYVPDHLGGGERYFFAVAEYLSRNHHVTVAMKTSEVLDEETIESIRKKYEEFFQMDLSMVHFSHFPNGGMSFFQKLKWTKQFDVMYYLTDGSLFISLAKKNVLHIQFPFTQPKTSWLDRLKLKNWQIKNTNSEFTKEVIERIWETNIPFVHYPAIDPRTFVPSVKKSKVILHVGRFFAHTHAKRQDVLVKAFKEMVDEHPKEMKGWQLVLIGGVEDEVFAQKVTHMAEGYPIKIIHNASMETLKNYYAVAKMYWHSTGYGIDEYIHPMYVEHFGISTVEAMSSGAVPIVINKGGQKELVQHGVNGYLWNETDALIERTLACISGEVDLKEMAEEARHAAQRFAPEHFYKTLNEMLDLDEEVDVPIDPNVSVVIPTFNGISLLKKFLPSVIKATRNGDEIVIVDDASEDETVSWLKKEYELKKDNDRGEFENIHFDGVIKQEDKRIQIKLIQNKKNLRFGDTANTGVEFATHDLIFLLNNDVKPHKDVLDILVPYFTHHQSKHSLFGVGCLEIQREGKREVKSGRNKLWFERGLFVHSAEKNLTHGETAWISGGSGLISKSKWKELGGFDLAFYPAYWEDIDLSHRAKNQGWKVVFEPQAIVEHHHESTHQTVFGQWQIDVVSVRNALRFTWKHASTWQRVNFFIWLPYHLTFTAKKTHGVFLRGFFRWILRK